MNRLICDNKQLNNDSNAFILSNHAHASAASAIQNVLAEQKLNANNDLFAFLQHLYQIQKKSTVVNLIIDFIKDFLLIPPEAFTIRKLSEQMQKIKYMVNMAIHENSKVDMNFLLITINQLTNLGAVLTGSMMLMPSLSNQEAQPVPIPSLLRPPYYGRDERMVFSQLVRGLPIGQQRGYFRQNPEHKKFIDSASKKGAGCEEKGDSGDALMAASPSAKSFGDRNALLVKVADGLIHKLTATIDEIDGDIRSQYQLSPPRFPVNVSPIERNLQYYIDLIEIMQKEENENQQYLNQLKTNINSQSMMDRSTSGGYPADGSGSSEDAQFEEANPYAFEINEDEDYTFYETRNNFLSMQKQRFVRPLFVYALASVVSLKSQRALFTLQVEGQVLCMLSVLLEELEKRAMTLADVPALLLATRYLSALVNITAFYTYGPHGVVNKMLAMQQHAKVKVQTANLLFKSFNRQFFSDPQTEKKFMIYKRGYMSTQVVIFNQIVNLYYYNNLAAITKARRREAKSARPAAEGGRWTPKMPFQAGTHSEFQIQDPQPADDIYVCQQLYRGEVPCDSMYFPMTIQSVPQETYFMDVFGNNVNRLYLQDGTFDLLCNCLAQVLTKIKLLCDSATSAPAKGQYEQPEQLLQLLQSQIKSIKATAQFQQLLASLHSESQEFNQLCIYYDDLLRQLREKEKEKEASDYYENSTHSVVNLRRQPEGSTCILDSTHNSTLSNNSQESVGFRQTNLKHLQLRDFQPIRYISKGGFGCVVEVTHKLINKPLVIKIIKKEDMIRKNSVNRIKLEAQIYKQLEQSNIDQQLKKIKARFSDFVVRFYGSFKTQSHLFIVLEFCQNGDLSNLLEECGSLGEDWSRFLIAEIIIGMSILHACGIIYNDMKPENILLGSDGHIKFTDFGISKIGVAQQLSTRQNGMKQTLMDYDTVATVQRQSSNHMVLPSEENMSDMPASANIEKLITLANADKRCSGNIFDKRSESSSKQTSFSGPIQRQEQLATNSLDAQNSLYDRLNSELHKIQEQIDSQSLTIAEQSRQQANASQQTIVGTPNYLAPELLSGGEPSHKSDFWAIGVTLYELVYGCKPFEGGTVEEIFDAIQNQDLHFPDDEDVSDDCRDILRQFLEKDPARRLYHYKEIQRHPFFTGIDWENIFRTRPYYVPPTNSENTVVQDEQFKEYARKGQNWVQMVLNENAESRPESLQGQSLEDQFKDFSFTNQQLLTNEGLRCRLHDIDSALKSDQSEGIVELE